jgi:hypothetical protein
MRARFIRPRCQKHHIRHCNMPRGKISILPQLMHGKVAVALGLRTKRVRRGLRCKCSVSRIGPEKPRAKTTPRILFATHLSSLCFAGAAGLLSAMMNLVLVSGSQFQKYIIALGAVPFNTRNHRAASFRSAAAKTEWSAATTR